jgi:hypothetical protein
MGSEQNMPAGSRQKEMPYRLCRPCRNYQFLNLKMSTAQPWSKHVEQRLFQGRDAALKRHSSEYDEFVEFYVRYLHHAKIPAPGSADEEVAIVQQALTHYRDFCEKKLMHRTLVARESLINFMYRKVKTASRSRAAAGDSVSTADYRHYFQQSGLIKLFGNYSLQGYNHRC